MRSLYKGIIGFGLVSIPIQVFKAMESERVTTHWIHDACHTRVQYQKYCPTCERSLDPGEVVTGAPLPDGRFVVLPPAEKTTGGEHTITILNFPELREIDPVFYETAYWLKPGPGGQKAYALLAQVMRDTGRVALAEMRLRSRPSLAVVRTFNDQTLMMHRMYYPESLRQEGSAFGPADLSASDKELDMAKTLVEHMAEPFDPARYPNEHRLEKLRQIEALMPTAEAPRTTQPGQEVLDLMEKLKASVQAQAEHGTGTE